MEALTIHYKDPQKPVSTQMLHIGNIYISLECGHFFTVHVGDMIECHLLHVAPLFCCGEAYTAVRRQLRQLVAQQFGIDPEGLQQLRLQGVISF